MPDMRRFYFHMICFAWFLFSHFKGDQPSGLGSQSLIFGIRDAASSLKQKPNSLKRHLVNSNCLGSRVRSGASPTLLLTQSRVNTTSTQRLLLVQGYPQCLLKRGFSIQKSLPSDIFSILSYIFLEEPSPFIWYLLIFLGCTVISDIFE